MKVFEKKTRKRYLSSRNLVTPFSLIRFVAFLDGKGKEREFTVSFVRNVNLLFREHGI